MPHRSLLRICYFGYLVIGLTITVIGPAIPVLQDAFGLSLGEVGSVFVAQGIGYAVAVLLGGALSDHIGRQPVLLAGSACLSCAFLAFFAASTWPVALLLFFMASVGAGMVESAINSLAVDVSGDEASRVLNLLHFFPAAGAVAGPYVAGRLLPYGWHAPFVGIGVLLAIFLLLALLVRHDAPARRRAIVKGPRSPMLHWQLYTDRRLLVLAALLALYVGAEASVSGWTFTYAIETLQSSPFVGSTITSLFWLGLMGGRMICSRISRNIGALALTAWMGAAAALVYMPVIGTSSPNLLAALTFAAGLLVGGVFPTVVAHSAEVFPERVGAATGFIIAICSVAGTLIPAVVGVVADGYGMRAGLAAVLFSLVAVSFMALVAKRPRDAAAAV